MVKLQDDSVRQDSIELKHAIKQVLSFLKTVNKPVTKSEIQSATGLSLFHTEDVLYELPKLYKCTLEANEKGEIVYNFDLDSKKTESAVLKVLKTFFRFIHNLFVFVLKLIITVIFFSYALTAGVAAAVIIAALAKSPNPIFALFLALGVSVQMLFADFTSFFSKEKVVLDTYNQKNIINLVFIYVFGYKRPIDELEREKELIEYIRLNHCKITSTDLVLLTGCSIDKANEELTLMLTHYRGEVYVSDSGVIIYHFPSFEAYQTEPTDYKKRMNAFFVWNNPISYDPYTYRKSSNYKIINGIAVFSVIAAGITFFITKSVYNLAFEDLWYVLSMQPVTYLGLSYSAGLTSVIALYLMLFFIVILSSAFFAKRRDRKYHRFAKKQNAHFLQLKAIFANLPKVPTDYFSELNENEKFDLSYQYKGELTVSEEDASLYYDFDYLHKELKAIENERSGLPYPTISIVLAQKGSTQSASRYNAAKSSGHFRLKHAVYIFIVLLAGVGILFSSDLAAINKSRTITAFDREARISVNHASPLYPWVQTENYKFFGKIEIRNASAERPFFFTDSTALTERITLHSANELILPKQMPRLSTIKATDIRGSIKLPEEAPLLYDVYLKNINSPIVFPKDARNLSYVRIINNNEPDSIVLPGYLPAVRVLQLDNCGITDPMPFGEHYSLEELMLARNAISELPALPKEFTRLKKVDFSENAITKLSPGTFMAKSLSDIILRGNNIQYLPAQAVQFGYMLDLAKNRIDSISPDFWKTPVWNLDLSDNLIRHLPEPDSIVKLSSLQLSGNQISRLPDSLHYWTNLQTLEIADNTITEIPAAVGHLKKLYFLNLNHNKIEYLPEELGFLSLQQLQIAGNPIKAVPASFKTLSRNCTFTLSRDMSKKVLQDFKRICGVNRIKYLKEEKQVKV